MQPCIYMYEIHQEATCSSMRSARRVPPANCATACFTKRRMPRDVEEPSPATLLRELLPAPACCWRRLPAGQPTSSAAMKTSAAQEVSTSRSSSPSQTPPDCKPAGVHRPLRPCRLGEEEGGEAMQSVACSIVLLSWDCRRQHVPCSCTPARERHSCTSSAVAPRAYSSSAAATRQRAASSERARLAAPGQQQRRHQPRRHGLLSVPAPLAAALGILQHPTRNTAETVKRGRLRRMQQAPRQVGHVAAGMRGGHDPWHASSVASPRLAGLILAAPHQRLASSTAGLLLWRTGCCCHGRLCICHRARSWRLPLSKCTAQLVSQHLCEDVKGTEADLTGCERRCTGGLAAMLCMFEAIEQHVPGMPCMSTC